MKIPAVCSIIYMHKAKLCVNTRMWQAIGLLLLLNSLFLVSDHWPIIYNYVVHPALYINHARIAGTGIMLRILSVLTSKHKKDNSKLTNVQFQYVNKIGGKRSSYTIIG